MPIALEFRECRAKPRLVSHRSRTVGVAPLQEKKHVEILFAAT